MPSSRPASRRSGIAIALSIAFHAAVLAWLAARPPSPTGEPVVEPSVVVMPVTIARRAARPVAPARTRASPAPAVIVARPRAAPRRPLAQVAAAAPRSGSRFAAPAPRAALPPRRLPTTTAAIPPPAAPSAIPVALPATPTPSPPPTPSPTPVAIARAGVGNFGETWDARPTPTLLAALGAQVAGHAAIVVDVDERGRAIAVESISGIADGALREALRRLLLTASYIPARCNGLDCAGTVRLAL